MPEASPLLVMPAWKATLQFINLPYLLTDLKSTFNMWGKACKALAYPSLHLLFLVHSRLHLCCPPRSSLLDVFWMFAGWCSHSLESSFYLDFGRQGWKYGRWSEQMFMERGWCSGLGQYNWTNGFIWEKVLKRQRLVVGWVWRLKGREGSWETPVYDLT